MTLYTTALTYFKELSKIPRQPLHEEKIRQWVIDWAEKKGWQHQQDTIGNLLVVAPGSTEKIVCLQSHLDMVCVAKGHHDFSQQGVTIEETDGIIRAKSTSLGADNGIGVATMMALADEAQRPTYELIFTIGEEIGLVGAQNIALPITAPLAFNLDWCNSESIGIGCGGTLLIQGERNLSTLPSYVQGGGIAITLNGMQGGHSGEDIRYYRGNAIIELLRLIQNISQITHIGKIQGGEADNVIPHSAQIHLYYDGNTNILRNTLEQIQKQLREKYHHKNITLDIQTISATTHLFSSTDVLPIIKNIIEHGTGVQVWGQKNTPLSSWNLGILSLENNLLKTSYFLRSNLPGGIEDMEKAFLSDTATQWTISHRSPPWVSQHHIGDVIKSLRDIFVDEEHTPLPTVTTHAAVECGLLAEKYPETLWISIGATVHNMHTTEEYISLRDFEVLTERMQSTLMRI